LRRGGKGEGEALNVLKQEKSAKVGNQNEAAQSGLG